ncbi:MAG: 5-formyltetrahydrofolate cyclo-ligase [Bacteroidia bacterium]|nr:5-formyltetrahydrofolate cyclo-ligase [Bacteroidia bacterium]MBP9689122.1 5-formyltetrahydrofolate cyclo-ligase [Bacteroidia bacterium]
MEEKRAIRNSMLQLRNNASTQQKAIWNRSITEHLELILSQGDIRVVHTFISMDGEVDLKPTILYMLAKGIKVICPKTLPERKMENRILTSLSKLENGVFGTQHPADPTIFTGPIDLVIVPGLAFDKALNRIGYGAGYYDTFLAEHKNAIKIGVCFPFQLIDKVPTEVHDAKLDLVIC